MKRFILKPKPSTTFEASKNNNDKIKTIGKIRITNGGNICKRSNNIKQKTENGMMNILNMDFLVTQKRNSANLTVYCVQNHMQIAQLSKTN